MQLFVDIKMANFELKVHNSSHRLISGNFYLVGKKPKKQNYKVDIELEGESIDDKHAIIEVGQRSIKLYDLHSGGGTFVNGTRLKAMTKMEICPNAEIRFAQTPGVLVLNMLDSDNKGHESSGFGEETKNTFSDDLLANHSLDTVPDISMTSSKRNSDSFNIPGTQHFKTPGPSRNSTLNIESDCGVDDSFIPETQEFVAPMLNRAADKCFESERAVIEANYPSAMTDSHADEEGSQFRIITQDFNEDCFGLNGESDLLDFVEGSQIIPIIQHIAESPQKIEKPGEPKAAVMQSKDEDVEMAALNWSAQTSSKCTTLNDTRSDERDNACTPDLFDLPELAQDLAKQAANNSKKSVAAATDSASRNNKTTAVAVLPVDALDLLPTQIFAGIDEEEAAAEPVYLTLSDKENLQPTAMILKKPGKLPEEATQAFPNVSGNFEVSEVMGSINKKMLRNSPATLPKEASDSITIAPSTDEDNSNSVPSTNEDTFLAATQPFPMKKPADAARSANDNVASTSKSLNKTQTPPNGFGESFKTPEKCDEAAVGTFKKPAETLSRKASSMSSVTSTQSSQQSECDIDLNMCTPQFLRDEFVAIKTYSNVSLAKQKQLFGNDSDEDSDVLKLLTEKKISNDFDTLLPHLKKNVKEEALNSSKQLTYNVFKTATTTKGQKKTEKSRDERHSARDKERQEQDVAKQKSEEVKEEAKTKRRGRPFKVEETAKPKEESARRAENTKKEEIGKTRNERKTKVKDEGEEIDKPVKRLRKAAASSKEKDVVEVSKVRSAVKEEAVQKPAQRTTRLKSRVESVASVGEENNEKSASVGRRSTRSHSTKGSQDTSKGSQENVASCSSSAKKNQKERKREEEAPTATLTERKRLRSTSSLSESSGTSSRTARLKVSMTMVDPDLFQRLAQNASDIWSVARDPAESDVLIMDKGNRTFKFLIAMAKGIPIVTSKWLERLNQTRAMPSNKAEHLFIDAAFEKRHKFTLLKSLEMARKHKLFAGYEFLLTPGILPQPHEMKAIIECAGGIVHVDAPKPHDGQKLYLVSTANDKKHWHKYRRINGNVRIINSEGIMASVMRQLVKPLDLHEIA